MSVRQAWNELVRALAVWARNKLNAFLRDDRPVDPDVVLPLPPRRVARVTEAPTEPAPTPRRRRPSRTQAAVDAVVAEMTSEMKRPLAQEVSGDALVKLLLAWHGLTVAAAATALDAEPAAVAAAIAREPHRFVDVGGGEYRVSVEEMLQNSALARVRDDGTAAGGKRVRHTAPNTPDASASNRD